MNGLPIQSQKQLGQLLKKRRKELTLTQKDVAKYCNLSHNGLSRIELGEQSARLSTLLKLSKILGFHLQMHVEDT